MISKTEVQVNLCTQYLVGAPLAQTPASVRIGMEAISL